MKLSAEVRQLLPKNRMFRQPNKGNARQQAINDMKEDPDFKLKYLNRQSDIVKLAKIPDNVSRIGFV